MSCCCDLWCTTRNYEPDGSANWQGPGSDDQGSSRQDIAIDSSGNAYTASGGIEKLDNTGARVYVTAKDGRFCFYGLNCICLDDDGTHGYVGSQYNGGLNTSAICDDNVFKFQLSDGAVVAQDRITAGRFGTRSGVLDCCSDGNGGVYFAVCGQSIDGNPPVNIDGSPYEFYSVAHYDSSFTRLDNIGCNEICYAICIDGDKNLYTAGTGCTAELDNGCDVEWTVKKYSPSGVLLDGIYLPGASAIAWRGGFLYVGFSDTNVASPCNVVKIDLEDWSCVWTFRVGAENGTDPNQHADLVRDIAVSDDGVYAVSNQYLFQLSDADGTKNWCRKNEGLKEDGITKKAGQIRAVAANDDYVWITGQATPCNDAEEDACESGACSSEACNCDCGEAGRRGGTLVNCDCDEVPCEFDTDVTSTCELLNASTIHWVRDADILTRWTGTLTSDCGSASFQVDYDCESETNGGWSIVATGIITSVTITAWFCTDNAPAGFDNPGFTGTFTVSGGTCDECEGCLAFGTDGAECPEGITNACCESIPTTLTASFADVTDCGCADGTTITLTYTDAFGDWRGSGTLGSCGQSLSLILRCVSDPEDPDYQTMVVDFDGCNVYTGLVPTSFSCSPFEWVRVIDLPDCCGTPGATATLTITA